MKGRATVPQHGHRAVRVLVGALASTRLCRRPSSRSAGGDPLGGEAAGRSGALVNRPVPVVEEQIDARCCAAVAVADTARSMSSSPSRSAATMSVDFSVVGGCLQAEGAVAQVEGHGDRVVEEVVPGPRSIGEAVARRVRARDTVGSLMLRPRSAESGGVTGLCRLCGRPQQVPPRSAPVRTARERDMATFKRVGIPDCPQCASLAGRVLGK